MASGRLPSTSTLAAAWCNRLDQFCTQLQRSCTSLHAIVQRKPEPESRGDNFDSFLEDLNDDVSSALAKLQQLEERTRDTLSFEELLVHCDALYKSNEDGISKLELQLQQYGYIPVEMPKEIHGELMQSPTHQEIGTDLQVDAISPPRSRANLSSTNDYEASVVTPMAHSYDARNNKRDAEYSPLFGDLGDLGSLESLGISATSLTALAGQDEPGEGSSSVHPLQHKLSFAESPTKDDAKISLRDAEMEDNLKTKYGSHWNSEAESKHPPLPSVPVVKYGSTYGNDERHLVPVGFRNSEAETKPPSLPSVPVAKYGSTSRNDERHPGPVVFNKPVSEYGNGATSSMPTTTVSKKDVTVQILETKKVTFLTEVTSVQYDNSPVYLKRMVSIQELNGAVTKINELIRQRSIGGQHANQFTLDQDDIQALGLGSKAKACIMLLMKADKLATQNTNGVKADTAYRICV